MKDHVSRVAELGMSAVGFTEHGNTSSHVQAERAGHNLGVKILYGCELYEAPTDPKSPIKAPIKTRRKYHQTVLAENEEGLQNLYRIVTASWRDSYYQWPTTSSALLKQYQRGLVVTSGCADSLLSCTLLGGKENGEKRLEFDQSHFDDARRVVEWYQDVFGHNYYLEVQRFPDLDRTCVLNPAFEELGKVTGAKLVATSDVHYPLPEHNDMQRILHASHRGGTVESADASWEYDILLTYPTSDQEIYRDLRNTGLSKDAAKQSILETARIAKRCNVDLPKNEPIRYPISKSDWDSWNKGCCHGH